MELSIQEQYKNNLYAFFKIIIMFYFLTILLNIHLHSSMWMDGKWYLYRENNTTWSEKQKATEDKFLWARKDGKRVKWLLITWLMSLCEMIIWPINDEIFNRDTILAENLIAEEVIAFLRAADCHFSMFSNIK